MDTKLRSNLPRPGGFKPAGPPPTEPICCLSTPQGLGVRVRPTEPENRRLPDTGGKGSAVVAPNYHSGGQFLPVLGQCDSSKDVAALHNAVKNGKDISSGHEEPFFAVPPLLSGKGLEKGREGGRLQGSRDSER